MVRVYIARPGEMVKLGEVEVQWVDKTCIENMYIEFNVYVYV